jgi:hypothetical protein
MRTIPTYEIEKVAHLQAQAIGGYLNLQYQMVTQAVDLMYQIEDEEFELVCQDAKAICQQLRDSEMARIYSH